MIVMQERSAKEYFRNAIVLLFPSVRLCKYKMLGMVKVEMLQIRFIYNFSPFLKFIYVNKYLVLSKTELKFTGVPFI